MKNSCIIDALFVRFAGIEVNLNLFPNPQRARGRKYNTLIAIATNGEPIYDRAIDITNRPEIYQEWLNEVEENRIWTGLRIFKIEQNHVFNVQQYHCGQGDDRDRFEPSAF